MILLQVMGSVGLAYRCLIQAGRVLEQEVQKIEALWMPEQILLECLNGMIIRETLTSVHVRCSDKKMAELSCTDTTAHMRYMYGEVLPLTKHLWPLESNILIVPDEDIILSAGCKQALMERKADVTKLVKTSSHIQSVCMSGKYGLGKSCASNHTSHCSITFVHA